MASAGAGSQSHLSGAYFQQAARHRVAARAVQGRRPVGRRGDRGRIAVDADARAGGDVARQLRTLRAIGHSLPKPTPLLPNIPPIADTIPGFDYSGWQGFFVPKGTPKAITDKLRAAVVKTMNAPEVKKAMAVQATEIVIRGPAEFRKVVQESMVQNEKLVKSLGLTAN